MFKTIKAGIKKDKDLPDRCFDLRALEMVLDGEIYDHLPYDFQTEYTFSGEYIPQRMRRPSVRYNMCKLVVDDSISMLFSEGHFPNVLCSDTNTRESLAKVIKESNIPELMMNAGIFGSVGSVAIKFSVKRNRPFFEACQTRYLTPMFDELAPDTLERVREQYKVRGWQLMDLGYAIDSDAEDDEFWFTRDFTANDEIIYQPVKLENGTRASQLKLVKDDSKSVFHGLGFVPVVWIKNLPGGKGVDGLCTFSSAIDTQIEMEYQLSQAGRGLKYSSDPTLLIKDSSNMETTLVKGAGNAIVVDTESDAKLLEINGKAAGAVIEYVRCLREFALEVAHGNRAYAENMGAATSGRAMELMNQAIIWLADKMRVSYGEGGLLKLMQMVVKASHVYPLEVAGKPIGKLSLDDALSLKWPAWYQPTAQDALSIANSLAVMTGGTVMSRETAIESLAADYDIEDVAEELSKIEADDKSRQEMAMASAEHAASLKPEPSSGMQQDNRTKPK